MSRLNLQVQQGMEIKYWEKHERKTDLADHRPRFGTEENLKPHL